MSYYDILLSNNPDKDYEFFWYSYKNLINKYLNTEEQKTISYISDKLNHYKTAQKYDHIKDLISDIIFDFNNDYNYKILQTVNYMDIIYLYNKLTKWQKINKTTNLNNNMFYILLSIANKCALKYNKNVNYLNILKIIKLIDFTKDIQSTIFIDILKISLENNFATIIDICKNINQFNEYIYLINEKFKTKNYIPHLYPGKKLGLFYKSFIS
jgi:hypothetical protein